MTDDAQDTGSSSAFDALMREAARQSHDGSRPLLVSGAKLDGGRFEVRRRVGQGGMGVVYEAYDAARQESVALKTLSRLEAGDVYRLKNEFRALAEVSHPNLVGLHELCVDGSLWFFTMDLVEGERFDHWVRQLDANAKDARTAPTVTRADASRATEERLRKALPQLVEGIAAIHAAGKLHRDLKPSNVLVTKEGRVVVLDFGLAIDPELGGVGHTVTDGSVSGTPAYMAPEQAAGQAVTAASDFYALGMMLFEGLTGRLPFEGRPHEMLVDKQRKEAPRASRLVAGVASDLDDVCARLLSRDPSARPSAATLRAQFPRLEGDSGSSSSRGPSTSSERGSWYAPEAAPELFGREAELAALREAFEATLHDQAVVVFVGGESGMGKSALCEAFLHELRSQGRATVLTGRCYERENVPFKGLDALVDDLSRHLRRLPREQAALLLPREVHALTRLFPVLGRVEVVGEAPKKEVPPDPLELRRRAHGAFGELMTRMRDRAPLCVHLDDVQWLDTDAVLFLRALLVQPEPPPALLLLSHRSEGAESNEALLRVRDAIEGNRHLQLCTLAVGPLSEVAARELAQRRLQQDAGGVGDASTPTLAAAAAIAHESGGSPFFAGELCRYVARRGTNESTLVRLSLSAALGDHLSTLPPAARRLLEHSALAGKPLPAKLLLKAAQASHAELDLLRASHLLRLSSLEGGRVVECYHDKVREMVTAALNELARVGCFAALAGALEAHAHPDAELLATCYKGAGQRAAAAEHYARAAEQAMAGTAFLHAAELYRKALSLGSFAKEQEHTLRVAHADALSQAGRGKQAADEFLRAAQDVQGAENRELRRRAALELSTTGHLEEGVTEFRALFAELGLTFPTSPGAALRRLLWSELRLRTRGLGYVLREESECSPASLEALSLQRSAARGLVVNAQTIIPASLIVDFTRRALSTGAPTHVAYALVMRAFSLSFTEPSATDRIRRLCGTALRISREHGDPALPVIELVTGNCYMNCGLWKPSREHRARALALLRGGGPDAQFNLDNLQAGELTTALCCGDWLHIANATPSLVEQAYSRDRIWAAVMFTGPGGARWLAGDDVTGCERVLRQAQDRWRPGKDALLPDVLLAWAQANYRSYRGQAVEAYIGFEGAWGWLMPAVARYQFVLANALSLRGAAALGALRQTGDNAAAAAVRESAKRLSRLSLPYAPAVRSILDAGLALHKGDVELGAKHLRAAVDGLDASDMTMHAAAARRRLGELLGGDEGKALLAQGDATMRAQQVVNLDAITEMLWAGCRAP